MIEPVVESETAQRDYRRGEGDCEKQEGAARGMGGQIELYHRYDLTMRDPLVNCDAIAG